MKYAVCYVTVSSRSEAKKISGALLSERIVACVNMIYNVKSLYWWHGKIEHSKEVLLIMKTKKNLFKRLEKRVKELHSYEVPEIIMTEISVGNREYLSWVKQSVLK